MILILVDKRDIDVINIIKNLKCVFKKYDYVINDINENDCDDFKLLILINVMVSDCKNNNKLLILTKNYDEILNMNQPNLKIIINNQDKYNVYKHIIPDLIYVDIIFTNIKHNDSIIKDDVILIESNDIPNEKTDKKIIILHDTTDKNNDYVVINKYKLLDEEYNYIKNNCKYHYVNNNNKLKKEAYICKSIVINSLTNIKDKSDEQIEKSYLKTINNNNYGYIKINNIIKDLL